MWNDSIIFIEISEVENKFFEIGFYSTLNVFPNLDVNSEQIIEIMNKAFLRQNNKEITWSSFLDNSDDYTKDR